MGDIKVKNQKNLQGKGNVKVLTGKQNRDSKEKDDLIAKIREL